MEIIKDKEFGGERPLYGLHDAHLQNVVIHVGESSIKESGNITAENCRFEGKYVFWETDGFSVTDCHFTESARSSLWYSRNCRMLNCRVEAPKLFRRMDGIYVENTDFPNGEQYLWDCKNIVLKNVTIDNCDYAFMHSENIRIDHYRQNGNYAFQYARNVEIHNAVINSKDALWEAENVTVYDSYITGEYLGWNSKNITFINCTIESLQGMCYMENVVMKNCKLLNTTLAFEKSTVDAEIVTKIDSVTNPVSGVIKSKGIDEIILDEELTDVTKTRFETI